MMIDLLRKPPAYLRAPQRRGTFFAPLPHRGPRVTLPRLFRRFDFLLQVLKFQLMYPSSTPRSKLAPGAKIDPEYDAASTWP